MKYNNSFIHLTNMRFYAFHGVLPQERCVGAFFFLTIRIQTDLQNAAETDRLSDTISYADIYQIVKEEMAIPSNLLEHVANRICQRIYKEHSCSQAIEISIEKENAPVGTGAQGLAGITLHTVR